MVYKFRFTTERLKKQRLAELRGSLISLAGLLGQVVRNQDGLELGTVVDLVFRWDTEETYPPLSGLIVKVARRQVWIAASNVEHILSTSVQLGSSKLDLRDFKSRPGEVRLAEEVLDHQLIDVDGARVVRAADLYIAALSGTTRLVGVDVSYKSLLRRLGPRKLRARPTPDVVIDWVNIQSFGGQEADRRNLRLSANRQELRSMRPGELADLLEDLGRSERQELLSSLTPELAADALEEMEPKELETILRESSPAKSARYLSRMEPDEAADALRGVDPKLREDLLARMTKPSVEKVNEVLAHDEESAGGIMNTSLMVAQSSETVAEVTARIKSGNQKVQGLDAVGIVNTKGKLVYDLSFVDLLLAEPSQHLKELIMPPASVSVHPDASLKEVAELLVESRRPSIVVTDSRERPIGRILADDVVDALLPGEGRFHFPRLLS